jgi:hypothetical protein
MKGLLLFLLAGLMSNPGPLSAQEAATLDEILARVQTRAGHFAQSLPDFVCDEKVTSKVVHRGKPIEAVIQSHFVGMQKKNGKMSFTETREVDSVNGKPARKGQKFEGPFLFGGGFSSILDHTFAPKFVPSHTYKITGEEMLDGRTALVIEFATRDGQTELHSYLYGKSIVQRDMGKAWIDKESLQVLRLERHYLNVPKDETPLIATVTYGEVRIDGKPFWMPTTVSAGQAATKRSTRAVYLAVYTNYHKFAVSSGIVYDQK